MDDFLGSRTICGFWRRIFALGLDTLLLGIAGTSIGMVFYRNLAEIGPWGRLLGFAVALSYYGILNSSLGQGQTLGKRIIGIEVVDHNGDHIGLGRSLIRYAILALPHFLNGLLLPITLVLSLIGAAIGLVVLGLGSITIYLYIFNRRTRQSSHDLACGTFVVDAGQTGPVAGTMWRGHLVTASVLLALAVGMTAVASGIVGRGQFAELFEVQEKLEEMGKVHGGSVIPREYLSGEGEEEKVEEFLMIAEIWKKEPLDYSASVNELVSAVFDLYPASLDKDRIQVAIMYGYDIGIARSWKTERYDHSIEDWQKRLDPESPKSEPVNEVDL